MVAATALKFYQITPKAGYLFAPELAWLTLATWLQSYVVRNNKSITDEDRNPGKNN